MCINKKTLTERDICTKYITPALEKSGWDKIKQIREEVTFTDGRIYVRGHLRTKLLEIIHSSFRKSDKLLGRLKKELA